MNHWGLALVALLLIIALNANAECECACVNGQSVAICTNPEPPPLCNQMCPPSAPAVPPMTIPTQANCYDQMTFDPTSGGLRWQQICQ